MRAVASRKGPWTAALTRRRRRHPPIDSNQIASLPLRIKALREQMAQIQSDAAKLGEAEAKIAESERKKKVQEDNYKYFATTLEQARIDEALGPGRISNIKPIQTPSPPFKDFDNFIRNPYAAVGGLLAGLAGRSSSSCIWTFHQAAFGDFSETAEFRFFSPFPI